MKCNCCGKENPDDTRFCGYCGEAFSVVEKETEKDTVQNENGTLRHQKFEGSVHKCPNCGEIVEAFSARCTVCGFEFRDTNSNERVKEFSDKLEKMKEFDANGRVKNYGQVADFIKNYAIPNTKEDVLEFMILASSSIEESALVSGYVAKRTISEAWITKMEQVYQKSLFSFGEDEDFEITKKIYEEKIIAIEQIKEKKKKETEQKNRNSLKIVLVICGAYLIFMALGWCFVVLDTHERTPEEQLASDKWSYEQSLDREVEEIEKCISKGQYDSAMIKAMGLKYDKYDDPEKVKEWDEKRIYLIDLIEKKQQEEEEKKEGGIFKW